MRYEVQEEYGTQNNALGKPPVLTCCQSINKCLKPFSIVMSILFLVLILLDTIPSTDIFIYWSIDFPFILCFAFTAGVNILMQL